MKAIEDAFGQALWNYYKGKRGFEIIERDDGYIDICETKLYFSEYKDWPLYQKKALNYAKGRVLDIGCGAGRHSLWLQKKGLRVLGIDNSPLAINACKIRGLKKTRVISITDINFKPNSFDTIIMFSNNFGLFGNPKKAKRLLKKFYKITSDNALIIAESTDPYKTNKPAHLEYHKLNLKKGRMCGQVRMRIRFEKFATVWFDYLLVSKKEMNKIVEGTGWKIKKFIDSKKSSYIAIIERI